MGRIRREAMDFQPDAVAVGEGRLPPQARIALYVIFAALIFFAVWSWYSELDRVVSAGGMLVTDVVVEKNFGVQPQTVKIAAEVIGALAVVVMGRWLASRKSSEPQKTEA